MNQKLTEYMSKRDFKATKEPKGDIELANKGEETIFVIQEHNATNLHYDFRLEHDGVLKSWAVPKGMPNTTKERRLAVETEDHPLGYAKFEGSIPEGQYGAGTVKIWDRGAYTLKSWAKDKIEFTLNGEKLKGRYILIKLKKANDKNWLLLRGKE